MNGAATISPLHTVKLCFCGHELGVHVVSSPPNANLDVCNRCISAAGTSQHRFQSANAIAPSNPFATQLKAGFTNAGVTGITGWKTPPISFAGVVNANATVFSLAKANITLVAPGFIPRGGDTISLYLASPNVGFRRAGIWYRVTRIADAGANVNVHFTPGALFTYASGLVVFAGADGSTQGAARPPNGQRAG